MRPHFEEKENSFVFHEEKIENSNFRLALSVKLQF